MKTNESLPLKEYKSKRKNALMDCLCAIVAAFLMMIPVGGFMYGSVITYNDYEEPASAFIMVLFLGAGIFVTCIILRLVYQQFVSSIGVINIARNEFITTAEEFDVAEFKMKKRKQKLWIVSAFSFLLVAVIVFNISSTIKIDKIYKSAEEYIIQERYKEAADLLKSIEEEKYKDTVSLITLCKCYLDYEKGRGADAYYDLKNAVFYWQNSEQLLKIREFENVLQDEHNQYIKRMAENARKAYEEKKRIEEAEEKIKSKSTSKYVPKYKEDKSDPYNAKDYRNEEDFYDDHYDDFFDYYDAEQYYRDHH